MQSNKLNDALTVATIANGAQLVAEIAKRLVSASATQKFNGSDLKESHIFNLSQSVFQAELLKKIGAK